MHNIKADFLRGPQGPGITCDKCMAIFEQRKAAGRRGIALYQSMTGGHIYLAVDEGAFYPNDLEVLACEEARGEDDSSVHSPKYID
jgi:hypothetical protein